MVVAANHVRNVHQRVVDRDHVVVDRDAFRLAAFFGRGRADNDGIADRLRRKLHFAAHQVVESQRVVFDLQPHGERLARRKVRIHLFRRKAPAPS